MDNNGYYEYAGNIAGGPSREVMFDSLRLGKIVYVEFIMTDKEVVDRKAVVICVERCKPGFLEETNDWVVELRFAGRHYPKFPNKEFEFCWKGTYSTLHRTGKLTGEFPRCLIRGQE
ncbi:MAG: hypothetical protein ACOYMB_04105 [Patescibacteria group bacterium]